MRRASPLLAIVTVALIVGIVGRGGPNSLARQEEVPPPTPLLPAPYSSTFQYQGVASCAAAACHHGNGPAGTKGSEYTTWIAQKDPHSRAYSVLFDRRSLLIEKNLTGTEKPHENKLCLSCHVNPDVETATHSDRFSRTDGVGCESCHGAAEKWLSIHFTAPWKNLPLEEKQRAGMIATKDVAVRAEVCVRCHVGWQDADVNHDLLAAGHPRLRFEYGAYLTNYPARHWKVADDRGRYGDFEARAWLVGQVASAKAALDLLEYRADPQHHKPWPEFAEYGCFGCHHDLRDQDWRQKRGAGRLPWGTWYFALRSIVGDELRSSRPSDLEAFEKLKKLMSNRAPDATETTREAARVSQTLARWADGMARECRDENALQKLLMALIKGGEDGELEWDGAAQRYLGIAAVYNSLSDIDARFKADAQLKSAVYRLADKLGAAFRTDRGVKYDSPWGFKPELLRSELRRLDEELRRRQTSRQRR